VGRRTIVSGLGATGVVNNFITALKSLIGGEKRDGRARAPLAPSAPLTDGYAGVTSKATVRSFPMLIADPPALNIRSLDPFDFLERSASIYRDKIAVIDGDARRTYPEFLERVKRLAAALQARGIRSGERVAVLAPNVTSALELTFAVPLAGGVVCALNTRLNPAEIDYILNDCGASLLIYDCDVAPLVDRLETRVAMIRAGAADDEYEALIAGADPAALMRREIDEDDTIAINYTSGTTGRPKGAMYTFRGAYLNALARVFHADLRPESVYLWTLPMFHCNG
jgi:fatty-acyl-CoA synthase